MTTSQQVYDLIVEQAARIVQQQEHLDAVRALHTGSLYTLCESCHTAWPCPTALALGVTA